MISLVVMVQCQVVGINKNWILFVKYADIQNGDWIGCKLIREKIRSSIALPFQIPRKKDFSLVPG